MATPGASVSAGSLATPGGDQGPQGTIGAAGTPGTKWWNGVGAPTPPPTGSNPGDYYLDTSTGDVWVL